MSELKKYEKFTWVWTIKQMCTKTTAYIVASMGEWVFVYVQL